MPTFKPPRLLALVCLTVVSATAAVSQQNADQAALLRKQLQDTDFEVRLKALDGLVREPKLVVELAAEVMAVSMDRHAQVRERTMRALQFLAADKKYAGKALPALLERFRDADARVRLAAVRATLSLPGSPHGKEAAEVLIEMLREKSDVRAEAVSQLAFTGEHGKKALTDVANLCKTGSNAEIESAVIVLAYFKFDFQPLLPDLARQVDTMKSSRALDVLADEFVKRDMNITPILRRLLLVPASGDETELLRRSFNHGGPDRTMKALVPLLKDPNPNVRSLTAFVMGNTIPVTHDLFPQQVGSALLSIARTDKELIDNLLANLKGKDAGVRWHSATVLVMSLSPRAKEVVPHVIEWLKTENPDRMGIHLRPSGLLLRPDSDKAAALAFDAVAKADDGYRDRLASAVTALPADTLRPYVLRALESDSLAYKRFAITALNQLPYFFTSAKNFPALMPAAAKLLGDDVPLDLRLQTAVFFIRSGDPKTRYDAGLLKVLEVCLDGDDVMRQRSLELLQAMGPRAAPAVPALLRTLKDSSAPLRFQAAQLLVKLDPGQIGPVIPVVKQLLESPAGSVDRESLLWFTATLGPRAEPLAPSLQAIVADNKAPHRLLAGIALLRLNGDPPLTELVLQAVRQEMASNPRWIREPRIIQAIRTLGPAARPILPAIEKQMASAKKPMGDDFDPRLNWAVTAAAIDPTGDNVGVRLVREILKNDLNPNQLCDALDELVGIGRHARVFLPELKPLLQAKAPGVIEGTIEVLATIGPDAKETLPQLRQIAGETKDARLRRLADRAIAQIGGR